MRIKLFYASVMIATCFVVGVFLKDPVTGSPKVDKAIIAETKSCGVAVEDLGWLPVVKELPIEKGTGLKAFVFSLNGPAFLDDHSSWRVAFVQNLEHKVGNAYGYDSYPQISQEIGGIEPGRTYIRVSKMRMLDTASPHVTAYFVSGGSTYGFDAYLK